MDQNHPNMHPISMNGVIAATTSVLFSSLFLYHSYSNKKKRSAFHIFLLKRTKLGNTSSAKTDLQANAQQ